jgi:cytochrome c biogenesis factor
MNIIAKPVNFKFSEYLNNGFNFFKANFGNLVLAYLLCLIMGIIPFCGILAVGNFYKYCRKLKNGEEASASEIFNFDDFLPFFILQLIVFAAIFIIEIPFFLMVFLMGQDSNSLGFFVFSFIIVVFIVFLVIAAKAFYIPGLIALNGIKDIKTVWNISKTITKGNLLPIVLFAFVISFLSELGIILCGIGIILTIPFAQVSTYFALEDGIQQIQNDEIEKTGQKE